ncbi:hypothetical protein C2G38_2048443 [Gigaspora rosea]|uniref:Uncharacterized protein n=1 Tax=Gigaspora rosea TaxID=44941 RepID=A0A397UAV3_9GLOM|nr:hypothetical protein C2G38_2048443 [Gigaspora rosea]
MGSFTSRYFTAGVQSTSRNEGENSTLKRLFGSSSLSLCELFEALEERYQEEVDYSHILLTQFLQNEFDVNGANKFANCVSNLSPDEISMAISKKCKFGELWELGRKIIVNAIEDSNEDIYHELLGFFISIQNRTSLQRVNNEVSNVGSNGCKIGYKELSTTSSNESVQDMSDTEESGII